MKRDDFDKKTFQKPGKQVLNKGTLEKIGLTSEELVTLIKKSDLFSSLDIKQCETLIQLTTLVILENDQVLFNQGDESDSMYFVIRGQLQAYTILNKNIKIVGMIQHGESVGELGVFSQKPRALSIKSIRLTILLRLSRENFIQFWETNTSTEFQMKLIDKIVIRAQKVIKLLTEEKSNNHSVIFSISDKPISSVFIEKIKSNSKTNNLLIFDEKYFAEKQIEMSSEVIRNIYIKSEVEKKSILFIISEHQFKNKKYTDDLNYEECQIILENSDNIYFVGCIDDPPFMSPQKKFISEKYLLPLTAKKYLILTHKKNCSSMASNTSDWLQLSKFCLHHHVRLDNDDDFKRLIRFIRDQPIGLVLSGGGSKGWASIGI
ncbi:MAG: cyclic nucleotide-binding domain-containing protein [Legionella longbeachae]|nr:cyclic nucleotide-binding domain-containing protein [Legionella longbeachae]